jgi:hypothetical protein
MNEELRRSDDVRLAVLEERIGNVIQNQESYAKDAVEWRNLFCKKLDVLIAQDAQRPCAVHASQLQSVGWLWKIVWGCVASVLGLAIVWGGLLVTVEGHTKAIDRITEASAYSHRIEGQANK